MKSPTPPHTCPHLPGSGGILVGSAKFAYMESGSQSSLPCPVGSCMIWEQGWCGMASGPFLCLDDPSRASLSPTSIPLPRAATSPWIVDLPSSCQAVLWLAVQV